MKIAYNWLKEYIDIDTPVTEVAQILTNTGLEVEGIEEISSILGNLEGLLIGHVLTRVQHPNADRLSVTTVDLGFGEPVQIVCGAANVAAGQKVVVAPVGATVYPVSGEPFKINKAKIRGEVSEGMICAEDEIGLGTSHEGIMVLPDDAPIGTLARTYFKLENEQVLEIGLTPNRADATSHIGVARDIAAFKSIPVKYPSVDHFKVDNNDLTIDVKVEATEACFRYSGVSITGVKVADSPEWLQKRLLSIGLKPINNIVDIANYVMLECGQPLHAFDAAEIAGKKIIIKTLPANSAFKTLEGTERKLHADDLMICDEQKGLCIAGVFGGLNSGVKNETTSIFLESACFNPVSVRKTSRRHELKTDASFRFERGTDPQQTVYALKRAALLIKEIAGGKISSEISDSITRNIDNAELDITFKNVNRIMGIEMSVGKMKILLSGLGIAVIAEDKEGMKLSIPTYKVDVTREVDVVEELLRIFGYNNVPIPSQLRSSLSFAVKPDEEKIQDTIANLLVANGFYEMMSNSLTKASYLDLLGEEAKSTVVNILNPLSNDLGVLRQTLLFSGLEAIAYNQNRKQQDLKLFEFGAVYHKDAAKYKEETWLSVFITGRKATEQWNTKDAKVDYYTIRACVDAIFKRVNCTVPLIEDAGTNLLADGNAYKRGDKVLAQWGAVKKSVLAKLDIDTEVYYAALNWKELVKAAGKNTIEYKEVSKFPAVRRDLSMLLDTTISFDTLKQISFQTERNLLKEVNIFDVYEGDKLPKGKKSYALSFVLQDENQTLTDKQIEAVMDRLISNFERQTGAEVRK